MQTTNLAYHELRAGIRAAWADIAHRHRHRAARLWSTALVGPALIFILMSVGGCDGDSSPTAPSSPDPLNLTGTFSGEASDSFGPGLQVTWNLAQSGTVVSGSAIATWILGRATGTVSGTLSGTTLTFTMTYPRGGIADSPDCSSTANGTAAVTNTTIRGTYSGVNSCLGQYTDGQFTLTKQ